MGSEANQLKTRKAVACGGMDVVALALRLVRGLFYRFT